MNIENIEKLSYKEKLKLTKYKNIPIEVLEILANDENYNIRQGVARNSNTPSKILEILANDETWLVRQWVARNSNTPNEVLEILANDEDNCVRDWLALNPKAKEVLENIINNYKNTNFIEITGFDISKIKILELEKTEDIAKIFNEIYFKLEDIKEKGLKIKNN